MSQSRRIAEHVSGNVVGWIEEPEAVDPNCPLSEQLLVKIGVINEAIASRTPLAKGDVQTVVDRLKATLAARGFSLDCPEQPDH